MSVRVRVRVRVRAPVECVVCDIPSIRPMSSINGCVRGPARVYEVYQLQAQERTKQVESVAAANIATLEARITQLNTAAAAATPPAVAPTGSTHTVSASDKQVAEASAPAAFTQRMSQSEKSAFSARVLALESQLAAQTTEVAKLQIVAARTATTHATEKDILQTKFAAELSEVNRKAAQQNASHVATIEQLQAELSAARMQPGFGAAAAASGAVVDGVVLPAQLDAKAEEHTKVVKSLQDELKACKTDLLAAKREVRFSFFTSSSS